jgi:hypothetical protein
MIMRGNTSLYFNIFIILQAKKFITMQKILIVIYIIYLSFTLISCKHETEILSVPNFPSIKFISGLNFVYNDTTLPKNAQFNVCLKGASNQNSLLSLSKLIITREINSVTVTVVDSVFNALNFNYIFSFRSVMISGNEKWKFKIFDSGGNSDEINFNITTKSFPPEVFCVFKNIPYMVNQPFLVAINAVSNTVTYKNLNRFVIAKIFEDTRTTVLDSTIDTRNLSYFATFTANSNPGNEDWIFRIYDKSNESDSISINVITGNFMTDEHQGIIWNSLGNNNYAWDLVSNLPVSFSESDNLKDMSNNTELSGSNPPYYFFNSWVAINSSLFKKANWYDYENASVETAVDAYTGGTIGSMPRSTANGLSEGDIFIGKLRNAENYTIIKITRVVFTVSDNNDNIQFSYKK